ncbi:DUF6607 family protein [Euryhalocaulis caribicus]|uniref:DUF6607 family protein n=1 Tax=Euryhalocaulis caribicus TaxID=1161401 RepID=UPI0003A1646F|nr:DUF6607 family protein [Euryhalocaulis caribicus]
MKKIWASAAGLALAVSACAAQPAMQMQTGEAASSVQPYAGAEKADYERDRQAILEMAGDFDVTFDFTETVPLQDGYELKPQKVTPTTEIVRVIEDEPGFISLQHILVMNHGGKDIVVKHWRQDWAYEPESILAYQGHDRWEAKTLNTAERQGAWSQTVYQVDDGPRYAAVAPWEHEGEISTWEPPVSWRPLPRRDATTRDDYDVLAAVNRHTVAPWGWWHEQDNHKLVLTENGPEELVREVGINSYYRTDGFAPDAGEVYWSKTADYWAGVRGKWTALIETGSLAIDDNAEGERLYMPVLELAGKVEDGEMTTEAALAEAREVIDRQTQSAAEIRTASN